MTTDDAARGQRAPGGRPLGQVLDEAKVAAGLYHQQQRLAAWALLHGLARVHHAASANAQAYALQLDALDREAVRVAWVAEDGAA